MLTLSVLWSPLEEGSELRKKERSVEDNRGYEGKRDRIEKTASRKRERERERERENTMEGSKRKGEREKAGEVSGVRERACV